MFKTLLNKVKLIAMQCLLMRTASVRERPGVAGEVQKHCGTMTAVSTRRPGAALLLFSDFHEISVNRHERGMLAFPIVTFTVDYGETAQIKHILYAVHVCHGAFNNGFVSS